jgi:hypothetical protein
LIKALKRKHNRSFGMAMLLLMAILSVATCFLAASLFIIIFVRRDNGIREAPNKKSQLPCQRDQELYATVPEQWLGVPAADIESSRHDGSGYESAPTDQAMVALDFSHLSKNFNPDDPLQNQQPVAYILDSATDASGESYQKIMSANIGTIHEFSAQLELDGSSRISQALAQVHKQLSPGKSAPGSGFDQTKPQEFRVQRGALLKQKPKPQRKTTFASSVEVFETYSVEEYDRKPIMNKTPGSIPHIHILPHSTALSPLSLCAQVTETRRILILTRSHALT